MDKCQQTRARLKQEYAHRVQLERGLRAVESLLTMRSHLQDISHEEFLWVICAIVAVGRGARDLESRYRSALKEGRVSIEALSSSNVRSLSNAFSDAALPGFLQWVGQKRPDMVVALAEEHQRVLTERHRPGDSIDELLTDGWP